MKIFIEYLLLIVSIAFVIDCIFTGVIRKSLFPGARRSHKRFGYRARI